MAVVTMRQEAQRATKRLLQLVEPEGYDANRWITMLRDVLSVLTDTTMGEDDAVADASEMYRQMYGAPHGGFADFVLWRDSEMELRLANQELRDAQEKLKMALDNRRA